MRHSDPKLTANIYTHVMVETKAEALAKLPAITATGTGKGKNTLIHAPSKNEKPLVPQELTRGEMTGAAYPIRTGDLRFTKSPTESDNAFDGKDLKEPRNPLSCQPSVSPSKPTAGAASVASLGDLAQIVAAWPRLPDAIKAGMVAMVKAVLDNT